MCLFDVNTAGLTAFLRHVPNCTIISRNMQRGCGYSNEIGHHFSYLIIPVLSWYKQYRNWLQKLVELVQSSLWHRWNQLQALTNTYLRLHARMTKKIWTFLFWIASIRLKIWYFSPDDVRFNRRVIQYIFDSRRSNVEDIFKRKRLASPYCPALHAFHFAGITKEGPIVAMLCNIIQDSSQNLYGL